MKQQTKVTVLGNDAVAAAWANKAGISPSALFMTEQRLLTHPFFGLPSQSVQWNGK
jgi:hypothetical protein